MYKNNVRNKFSSYFKVMLNYVTFYEETLKYAQAVTRVIAVQRLRSIQVCRISKPFERKFYG